MEPLVRLGLDFKGFGLHSFRRANITWRQEVGASAIEASKIAGHGSVNMTNDYTHVQLKRQEELTRAIQDRLESAAQKPIKDLGPDADTEPKNPLRSPHHYISDRRLVRS